MQRRVGTRGVWSRGGRESADVRKVTKKKSGWLLVKEEWVVTGQGAMCCLVQIPHWYAPASIVSSSQGGAAYLSSRISDGEGIVEVCVACACYDPKMPKERS